MLPREGGFAIMLQETEIATRAQEMHVAAALRDKGYTPFFSSRLAETGATSTWRGGVLLTAVSSKYVAEHEVLSFTEWSLGRPRPWKSAGTGEASPSSTSRGHRQGAPRGRDGRRSGPTYKCMPRRAASVGDTRWSSQLTPTSTWLPPPTQPWSTSVRAGRPAVWRATAGGEEDMTPTLHPSRHRVDTFLVSKPLLPWSLRESVWARGMAHPQVIGSDHLPVRLALPGLLNAAGRATMPTPYSHTEGRLLPYDAEPAPVQHCLWAAVTAAQNEPSLAPWLGPAEQHAYGSMPAATVNKVFEHLHAGHDALARVVGRRQPCPEGTEPAGGDPHESGKRL